MSKKTSVLFVASEVTPLAKVGGLADVVGALPKALRKNGVDARILMPKYGAIDPTKYPMTERSGPFEVLVKGERELVKLFETRLPDSDVPIYLIENERYFGGDRVYYDASAFVSQFIEFERFLFFGLAIPVVLPQLDFSPDIIHCHDWHTGAVPLLVRHANKAGKLAPSPAFVFTIHNLANQGRWNAEDVLAFLGLSTNDDPLLAYRQDSRDLNLMALGISSADAINTVSPSYAQEILTPEYGEKLEAILGERRDRLSGILNGIDIERFNPATDPALPVKYSADTFELKAQNKHALQQRLGLRPDPRAPLFGFIGRLTDQKGMDLLEGAMARLCARGGQIAILGTGMSELELIAREAAKNNPEMISATIGFDASLAQLIYAGADFFLMPSRFEPCGLGQMIAMRYGTIPIVRATGGLRDTVQNYMTDASNGRGFVFEHYTTEALRDAIERALELYADQSATETLARRLMSLDFSWDSSARLYIDLYKHVLTIK